MPDDQIWIFSKITLGIKYRIDWKMNWKIKIQVMREFNSPFISYLYWIPIFCNSSGHPNEGFYTLVISDSFNSGNHSFMLNWEQWWGKDAYCNTEWSMNSSNNISCASSRYCLRFWKILLLYNLNIFIYCSQSLIPPWNGIS